MGDGSYVSGLRVIALDFNTEQLKEGMEEIKFLVSENSSFKKPLAIKYCGGGFGGYVLAIFEEECERDSVVQRNERYIAMAG